MTDKMRRAVDCTILTAIIAVGVFSIAWTKKIVRPTHIGECPKCEYEVEKRLLLHIDGHYKIPRWGCPYDGAVLDWRTKAAD
jgi:hypothetical protein